MASRLLWPHHSTGYDTLVGDSPCYSYCATVHWHYVGERSWLVDRFGVEYIVSPESGCVAFCRLPSSRDGLLFNLERRYVLVLL